MKTLIKNGHVVDPKNKIDGISNERMKKAKKDALIMHPGPINRGVELSGEVADGSQSVFLDQVTNGVAVRMAVLFLTTMVER